MKIHKDLAQLPTMLHPVVTIGTFDGVHLGHQKILYRIRQIAQESGGESVLLTFWPHPRMVLKPNDHQIKLLSTQAEKQDLIAQFGIDHLVSIPFTKSFAATSSEEFIQDILIKKLRTSKLVIGYDHRFGKGREGGFDYLQSNQHRFGFELEEIPRADIDQIGISSTKIRQALEAGDLETASNFLGRPYGLTGRVVKGNQLGRKIGFPTANLHVDEEHKLIPKDGAYVVSAKYRDKQYPAMLNIGNRPTLQGANKTVEAHLIGFEGDLYGEQLEIRFHRYLREEQKFDNLEQLTSQLRNDKQAVMHFFR
ncbi:bifunctional riboflavin kinase/FAD synthetase [Lunatimonas salinarum]|uniref:bifunctional riboflavin kinase/FAD synthetase n=1 Tax=Lunatimonas salinarum TaxID=1774590 RepID=UPI001ADFB1CE|nr:bifunctional riboflavin kinase/FAD synthetase [Lunatimonas salinarum]